MTISEELTDDWNGRETVAQRVFRTLAGQWRFDRTIPGIASLVGQAVFAPAGRMPTSLCYEERGDLRLDSGATYAAAGRYLDRLIGERIVIELAHGAN